jgi:hypothetical protein
MGDGYYLGLLLMTLLLMVISAHLDFLATANRYDQRELPQRRSLWRWDSPKPYTEKGKRYRRQAITVQLLIPALWVVGLLVAFIVELA